MNRLNWPQLISDISEALVLNQNDLGESIGTTQQSISNWLNGRRIPSKDKAQNLLKLAAKIGIDLTKYKVSKKEKAKIDKYQEFKELPVNIRKLTLILSKLSTRRGNSTLRYLEDMR